MMISLTERYLSWNYFIKVSNRMIIKSKYTNVPFNAFLSAIKAVPPQHGMMYPSIISGATWHIGKYDKCVSPFH